MASPTGPLTAARRTMTGKEPRAPAGAASPPGAGPTPGPDGTGTILNALIGKLGELAATAGQRELMTQLHRITVLRLLRRAGCALTIRDAAVGSGLRIYTAEAALEFLRENGLALRDTATPAWTYRAAPQNPPRSGRPPPDPAGQARRTAGWADPAIRPSDRARRRRRRAAD